MLKGSFPNCSLSTSLTKGTPIVKNEISRRTSGRPRLAMSLTQLSVLGSLQRFNSNGATSQEILDRTPEFLNLDVTYVSSCLHYAIKEGMVSLIGKEGRAFIYQITPKGRKEVARTSKRYREISYMCDPPLFG